jgi:RNA polymerase sigma-70 factor (ECF subfamily)
VDTAAPKPDDLVLPIPADSKPAVSPLTHRHSELQSDLLEELWASAEAEACGLTLEEFAIAVEAVGAKFNYGHPTGALPDAQQKVAFFRSLHLVELALAYACALGREIAWERFVGAHRAFLVQTASAITGSAALGEDLAGSLYAELYGLRESDGERRSPMASYSGRGSLRGWLRTTLVQRYRDHFRRTRHETQLDEVDRPAPTPVAPLPAELTILNAGVARTLRDLVPEDRFLLASYYLDRQTLLQIAQTLQVHEATISRRLKRLVGELRGKLLRNLQRDGLSKRAAEEAMGADPRDLEINLRRLLQTSQVGPFMDKTASAPNTASDSV